MAISAHFLKHFPIFPSSQTYLVSKSGDKLCLKILDDMYFYLSIGIINIMNIFAPEVVIIGGGISNQEHFLLNGIKMALGKITTNKDILDSRFLQLATLKEDAGIIGAALLGKSDFE